MILTGPDDQPLPFGYRWAFASRQDMDNVAAFVVDQGMVQDAVISAYLSWKGSSDTFVRIERYASFWDWLSAQALPDMAGWPTEADIQEALERDTT